MVVVVVAVVLVNNVGSPSSLLLLYSIINEGMSSMFSVFSMVLVITDSNSETLLLISSVSDTFCGTTPSLTIVIGESIFR